MDLQHVAPRARSGAQRRQGAARRRATPVLTTASVLWCREGSRALLQRQISAQMAKSAESEASPQEVTLAAIHGWSEQAGHDACAASEDDTGMAARGNVDVDMADGAGAALHRREERRVGGASEALPWFLMSDVIDVVLLRIRDGRHLAKCCGVNRLWQQHAGAEAVWQALVLRRWCVSNVKRHHEVCMNVYQIVT